jgi:hypothetical protein
VIPLSSILPLVVLAAALPPAIKYVRHAYSPFPKATHVENQYEFLVTQWVHDHLPGERVLPSGTVRFWYDAWFDNAQPEGGSDQGMLNPVLPAATYQITAGDRGQTAILWMQALGTDAVIVPDRTAPEPYHDYPTPYKFRGLAPVLYDDQHGTVIYRIPRIYPGIGRVVKTSEMAALGPVVGGDDIPALTRYVAAIENPEQRPAPVTWKSFDEAELQGHASAGQSILFQETYDPAWRAYENGRPVPIREEPVMDFMLLDVPEGNHIIQFRFETPAENRIGAIVSGLGFALVLTMILAPIWRGYWRRRGAPVQSPGR